MRNPSKSKVSLLLDKELFRIFDAYCRENGLKKSTFIVKLLRDHLSKTGFGLQAQFPKISDEA